MSGKAVIIGSGVAGLASAIRLAVMGFEVNVYEKNAYPGGKLSMLKQDGYSFDTGPSLFTQPQHIEALFELAGEPIGNYFAYKKLDITCNYFFENGKTLSASADRNLLAKGMSNSFNEPAAAVHSYLESSEKLYSNIGAFFVGHSLHKWRTYFKPGIVKALLASRPGYLFKTLNQFNASHFKSPETIQLFNRYATYNGSNPYKAPGMLSLIPNLEMTEGSFYPAGGMISICNALFYLAQKKGVIFHFNSRVNRINTARNRVTGICTDGEDIKANIVVSNMDAYFTYKLLLQNEARSQKVLKQERSSSALIFYWGIGRSFPALDLHNIFFSNDYQNEFDHIFRLKTLFTDPTVYINVTSKMESGHAPAGKENWFVMINVPANTGQDWDRIKQEARALIIAKLSKILKTDIGPLIETEAILDPVKIESETASYMGSLYGTSSNSKLAAFFRHPNFTNKIKGLYFVGGSVHPGGGIPLCFQSARIMSDIVKVDYKL